MGANTVINSWVQYMQHSDGCVFVKDRYSLLSFYRKKLAVAWEEEMRATAMKYSEKMKQLNEIRSFADIEVMKKAKVLGIM